MVENQYIVYMGTRKCSVALQSILDANHILVKNKHFHLISSYIDRPVGFTPYIYNNIIKKKDLVVFCLN